MDRTSISRRIGSIKGDIEKLSNTLCAIEKTDIENYPDNYWIVFYIRLFDGTKGV